jgi:hypothetical protein
LGLKREIEGSKVNYPPPIAKSNMVGALKPRVYPTKYLEYYDF